MRFSYKIDLFKKGKKKSKGRRKKKERKKREKRYIRLRYRTQDRKPNKCLEKGKKRSYWLSVIGILLTCGINYSRSNGGGNFQAPISRVDIYLSSFRNLSFKILFTLPSSLILISHVEIKDSNGDLPTSDFYIYIHV